MVLQMSGSVVLSVGVQSLGWLAPLLYVFARETVISDSRKARTERVSLCAMPLAVTPRAQRTK